MNISSPFSLVYTTAFGRDIKLLVGRNQIIYRQLLQMLDALRGDPYNTGKKYNIKKLTGISPGEGQWRIRVGKYRLRYDILDQNVVLFSFSHRKDSY